MDVSVKTILHIVFKVIEITNKTVKNNVTHSCCNKAEHTSEEIYSEINFVFHRRTSIDTAYH